MNLKQTQIPDFLSLTKDLCKFATGVVASENASLFDRLKQELPFKIYSYASGETYNGWLVPQQWSVEKALIYRDNKIVFDGKSHTLGVGRYSKSFQGELDWEDLKTHLVTNPELPSGYMFHCMWQYRPWAADWAMCIPYEIYQTLEPGSYRVDLVTRYEPGEMLVGEYEIKGRSDRTIVLQNNTCHPHQANDGFAATAILIRLFQWLKKQDNYYSYRLILCPEHLGTVFYLRDRSQTDLEHLVCGIFTEMPGTPGPIRVTSTFLGNLPLDRAFRNALRHHSNSYNLVPWRRGAGNDETVWEAPGYEVPFVEMTRCLDSDYPYPEYHSSLDNPDLMDKDLLAEYYQVLQRTIEILERNVHLYRHFNGLICLSNPEYDLYFERYDPTVDKELVDDADKWGHLLDSLFRYFDGTMSILDIAEKHDLPFDRLYRYLLRFQEKGLISLEFDPISRIPISQPSDRSIL
ncbi:MULTISPECIES: DUF4910 domain-containing protein [Spirulina sp. CCY15215]|uniref:DUF4910 domain-containing protein n=1 Tax=Spirulina sp. CCY15215 TaxID=2767591 RepID=UPI00195278D1